MASKGWPPIASSVFALTDTFRSFVQLKALLHHHLPSVIKFVNAVITLIVNETAFLKHVAHSALALSHFNHDSLGGSLLSNQQHSLPLLHDGLHQEVRPHVVHVGNQDGGVVRDVVFGVDILWDLDGDSSEYRRDRRVHEVNLYFSFHTWKRSSRG